MLFRPSLQTLFFLCAALLGAPRSTWATVKLSGSITNKVSDSISVSFSSNKLAYYPQDHFARPDGHGRFAMEFPFPAGMYIQVEVRHGRHICDVMLHDGDSLVLQVDTKRFDSSLRFLGRGAAIQNFVAQHTLTRGRINQYNTRLRNHVGLAPDAYLAAIEKEKKDELDFTSSHRTGLPENFISFWNAHFTYFNYFFLQQYPQMHEIFVKNRYTDTIPDANYAVIKDLPVRFDDKLIHVPAYLLYLSGIFESKLKAAGYAQPLNAGNNATLFLDSVNSLAAQQMPSKSAEYFFAQSLYGRARNQPIERTRAQHAAFSKRWPGSEYAEMVNKQVALAERLSPGQPAPDLNITMADGTHKKLSDLKGKVVYLSFWSARVKQTVGLMRADKKIREVFVNKPVEFVYVCIDDDSVGAKAVLEQLKLEGNFVWTNGNWYAPEAQAYGVQGLPAHYLIDTNGNFAVQNPPNAMQKTEMIVAISKLY